MLNFDWSVGGLLTSESVHSFLSFKVTKIVINITVSLYVIFKQQFFSNPALIAFNPAVIQ